MTCKKNEDSSEIFLREEEPPPSCGFLRSYTRFPGKAEKPDLSSPAVVSSHKFQKEKNMNMEDKRP